MTAAICHEDIDILLAVCKVTSFNIRSPLMKTLDWSVETLGRECNHSVAIIFVN